jgi:hypothetical protein
MLFKLADGTYIDTVTRTTYYPRSGNNGTWTVAVDGMPNPARIIANNFQYKEDAQAALEAFMADKGFLEIESPVTPPTTPEGALVSDVEAALAAKAAAKKDKAA